MMQATSTALVITLDTLSTGHHPGKARSSGNSMKEALDMSTEFLSIHIQHESDSLELSESHS